METINWRSAFRAKVEAGIQPDTPWVREPLDFTRDPKDLFFSIPGYFYVVRSDAIQEVNLSTMKTTSYQEETWEPETVYLDGKLYIPYHDKFHFKMWIVLPNRRKVFCIPPHPDGIEIKRRHDSWPRHFALPNRNGSGIVLVTAYGQKTAERPKLNLRGKFYQMEVGRFIHHISPDYFSVKNYEFFNDNRKIKCFNLLDYPEGEWWLEKDDPKQVEVKSLDGLQVLEATSFSGKIYLICCGIQGSLWIVTPKGVW